MPTGPAADQAAERKTSSDQDRNEDKGPGSVAGNLCDDPELRYTPNGRAVASLRVAVSERVKDDRTGQWKDGTTAFYSITAWGTLAENCVEVLVKGDRIVAEGRWTSTKWTDKDGNEQERVFLTARDLGPSMMFRCARPVRPERNKLWPEPASRARSAKASARPTCS